MRATFAVLFIAIATGAGCASGSRRAYPVPPAPGVEGSGFGSLTYGPLLAGTPDDEEMESMLREHYAGFHVTPAEADCLIEQATHSPQWQPETRALSLSADDQNAFAESCHIDWRKLWLEPTD